MPIHLGAFLQEFLQSACITGMCFDKYITSLGSLVSMVCHLAFSGFLREKEVLFSAIIETVVLLSSAVSLSMVLAARKYYMENAEINNS